MKYKLLVTTRDGNGISSIIVEYDSRGEADIAYNILNASRPSNYNLGVIALYH